MPLNTSSSIHSAAGRIAAQAERNPNAAAIVSGSSVLTFRELEGKANHLAHRLREAGVTAEVPVALLLNRSADYVVAALAVMKAGGAYLPLDPGTPAARSASILKDSGAALLIAHRCAAAGLEPPCTVLYLDTESTAGMAHEPPACDITPGNLAYLIYTSGSTGEPKGVEVTHGNLNTLIEWHTQAFAITAEDRASQMAGLGFDASVWEIWCHLSAGACLYLAPSEDIRTFAPAFQSWLVENGITVAFAPTVIAQQLIAMDWPAESRLRILLTGAERLQQRPPANLPFLFFNNYGPTEATVVTTSGLVAPAGDGAPSIGMAANGARIHILDGELCIAGPLVARGYRNRPEMTASKFVTIDGERMYRTGDRARQLPSGEYEFLGRLDNQVKIRGYRVELDEIATTLAKHPAIRNSVAVAVDDATLVAYYVARSPLTSTELTAFLAPVLPQYMIPSAYIQLEALPMTANGKCDYKALPAPAATTAAPQSTDIPVRLGAMVASLLKQPSVDPDANFFFLGGHSLLAAQLLVQVNTAFGVKMALRQMFQAPTVNKLSMQIAGMKAGK
ncbi:non-ribosomal peptide synthetase [Paludibaculum fermentans]|uniref:Non-ribosomal peptide synthetase n=1 Tax=Paludibaculum fermentans TaxID=1473598 RepID=A0A7S7SIT3_PALFE|nr:non-ribosomal peptide synthetase [Paludibaculum fermentans]QOY86454.1 non-ribosomal peptide synthetase [Paludibaculum fermentans]